MNNEYVLVTGGCGYIGSHTVVELLNKNYNVTIIDNLCNSDKTVLKNFLKITGKKPQFIKGDLLDVVFLEKVFKSKKFSSVIHFAGLKAVGESVEFPLKYYKNNIVGTINLLECMSKFGVNKIVFSSSATVYGEQSKLPYVETMSLLPPTNPYGATKSMCEQLISDVAKTNKNFFAIILRYFNPIGAHPSGLIGENPSVPNNLAPYILQVAGGKRTHLNVFANDYPTVDGTGVRDYLHVVDLSIGHTMALEKIKNPGIHIYNLGTGKGTSVFQLLRAYEKAVGKEIPYKVCSRRSGDLAECYAGTSKIEKEIGWKTKYDIEAMCEHSWKYYCENFIPKT